MEYSNQKVFVDHSHHIDRMARKSTKPPNILNAYGPILVQTSMMRLFWLSSITLSVSFHSHAVKEIGVWVIPEFEMAYTPTFV